MSDEKDEKNFATDEIAKFRAVQNLRLIRKQCEIMEDRILGHLSYCYTNPLKDWTEFQSIAKMVESMKGKE